MILNSQIWRQTIAAALVAVTGNTVWIRAIERGAKEIEKAAYWSFADGVLKLKSTTSGKLYVINEQHTCEAQANGHKACKHRAAHRLMTRYLERLKAFEAQSQTAKPSMLDEANKAVLVTPQIKGESYNGIDV